LSGVSAEVDVTLGIAKEWERFEFNNQGEFMKKVQVACVIKIMENG